MNASSIRTRFDNGKLVIIIYAYADSTSVYVWDKRDDLRSRKKLRMDIRRTKGDVYIEYIE